MKIQIASDLHFELWKRNLPDRERQFAPDKDRDLLILAGDITDGNRDHGIPFIRRELKLSPVIFVPGNHEYHHAPKREVDAFWRDYAERYPGFYYLNDDTVEIRGLARLRRRVVLGFPGRPAPSLLPHDDRGLPGDAGLGHLRPRGGIQADQ